MRCRETARSKREKLRNMRKGDKRFVGEGGAEVVHWQRGCQIEEWRYTQAGGVQLCLRSFY